MNKKVLIIEDNPELQEIYTLNFEISDFDVEVADNWLEWIQKLLENPPDIIILDIMMPNMDGFQVLKTLKNEPDIQVPVIVCSNLSSSDDVKRALYHWADSYLQKSDYDGDQIVEEAIKVLKNKKDT